MQISSISKVRKIMYKNSLNIKIYILFKGVIYYVRASVIKFLSILECIASFLLIAIVR